jgi:branched-chain amino acid transport system permease protein
MTAELTVDPQRDEPRAAPASPRSVYGRLRVSRVRYLLPVAAVGVAIVMPAVLSPFRIQVLMLAFLNAASAVGLMVSFGFTGMLNISQATFVGVGAYATAILMTEHGQPFLLTVLVGMVLAAGAGLVLGFAALRVEGDYFSLVSLAFTIAVAELIGNWKSVTRGREGYFGIPRADIFGFEIVPGIRAYYLALAVLVVCVVVVVSVTSSYAGRAMLAVGFDPVAAKASGISVPAVRLVALAIGSALAGAVGSVQVATIRFISPADFDLITSFNIMVWVIIGGMTRMWGVVGIAIVITYLTEELREYSEYRIGVMGLLILVAVFIRGGVTRDWRTQWAARLRRA